jgi:anthranilate synthase/aminodeoxychorismate synthase-like glutamine amidotransferase
VVLSPGPGNPTDFELSKSIELLIKHKIPGFGVCLGLQGMVEYFGGKLGVLGYPMHGKPSEVALTRDGLSDESIFTGLPETFEVARYHSLHGLREHLPKELKVTALSEDGIVMAIQHSSLPFAAVQFHPESILTSPSHGMTILENALRFLKYHVDDLAPQTGAKIVGQLEQLDAVELKQKCGEVGVSSTGSKSELVVRLALYTHKRAELVSGRLCLENLDLNELEDLAAGLGLKTTKDASSRDAIVEALKQSLTATT